MRQLLRKNKDWKRTEKEEADFKKRVAEISCFEHFARDRDNIVTIDEKPDSNFFFAKINGQYDPTNSVRQQIFERRWDEFGELDLLAMSWGIENFRFQLYGKEEYLYTDDQVWSH